jgi:hypothetical protein
MLSDSFLRALLYINHLLAYYTDCLGAVATVNRDYSEAKNARTSLTGKKS